MSSRIEQNRQRKTSIVILTYNKLEYTKACIDSIRRFTEKGTYELIVVDNHSTDGTRAWLSEEEDIISILNDENLGFPRGCNQGIEVATGDSVLLLNNDTVVTKNWLDNLCACLYSSEEIGAVGPLTNNSSYYQAIQVNYNSLPEMWVFAEQFNRHDPDKWEQRLKLIGFCMLIKREVINQIGMLDERFTPGNYEDDDYSFRIMQAGYQLQLCKDVFIHHFGSTSFKDNSQEYTQLLKTNEKKFIDKWGFTPSYSTFIRHEIINMMDEHDKNEPLHVLEVGCACGGTLLQIKNKYKNTKLYGIEFNEHSAAIAGTFADVIAMDAEKDLSYPEKYFDYIILADVLEHLYDPWKVLENLKKHLKEDGKVIASIPNVMHYSVLKDLIEGKWTYTDAGLLDRTHVRFFTYYEIEKLFLSAGFNQRQYQTVTLTMTENDQVWLDHLNSLAGQNNTDQYKAYQYIIKASIDNTGLKVNAWLQEIENGLNKDQSYSELVKLIVGGKVKDEQIISAIIQNCTNKQEILNDLAVHLYNNGYYNFVIPLLRASLSINEEHVDTIMNLALIFYETGEKKGALDLLERINSENEEVLSLKKAIIEQL